MSRGNFTHLLWKCFMGPVCQKHLSLWGNFLIDYLVAVTAGEINDSYSHEKIKTLKVISCLCPSSGRCSIMIKINLALRCFWQITPIPLQTVSILSFTSQKTSRISQNALCLLGKRHSEGRVVVLRTDVMMWWQRCRRSIQRVLFCISEGNRLFHIFIFVQTFRS